MRENIDLFKDNMRVLKDQNDELQQRIANQSVASEKTMNGQIKDLFEGLKDDNIRLADEVKRLQEENYQMS